MSEMVERVAMEIAYAAGDDYSEDMPYWNKQARAAIAAMREPTFKMQEAGYVESQVQGFGRRGVPLVFTRMVDEALR